MLVETKSCVLLWFGLVITKSKIGPVRWLPVHLGCPFDWKLKEQMHRVAVAFVFPIFFVVSCFLGRRAVNSIYLSLESVPFPCHIAASGPTALASPAFRECSWCELCPWTSGGPNSLWSLPVICWNCHMVHQALKRLKTPVQSVTVKNHSNIGPNNI